MSENSNAPDTFIKEVYSVSIFPNREAEDFTYAAFVEAENGHHLLIWSPHVKKVSCSISLSNDSFYEDNPYAHSCQKIMFSQTVYFLGTAYSSQAFKEGYYFKIIDLDASTKSQRIPKSEIEKIFKCEVDVDG